MSHEPIEIDDNNAAADAFAAMAFVFVPFVLVLVVALNLIGGVPTPWGGGGGGDHHAEEAH